MRVIVASGIGQHAIAYCMVRPLNLTYFSYAATGAALQRTSVSLSTLKNACFYFLM